MDSTAASLSAIRAFDTTLSVIANNIANVATEGFKKSRVILEEAVPSGVSASIGRVNQPGAPIPDTTGTSPREGSNVSIEEEMAALTVTQQSYTANLKVLQALDEIQGRLMDLLA